MLKSLAGFWDFLGGPVVRTQRFQGLGSIPGWGLKDPTSHVAQEKKKKICPGSKSSFSLSLIFNYHISQLAIQLSFVRLWSVGPGAFCEHLLSFLLQQF